MPAPRPRGDVGDAVPVVGARRRPRARCPTPGAEPATRPPATPRAERVGLELRRAPPHGGRLQLAEARRSVGRAREAVRGVRPLRHGALQRFLERLGERLARGVPVVGRLRQAAVDHGRQRRRDVRRDLAQRVGRPRGVRHEDGRGSGVPRRAGAR
jgi:hypothetical protein